MAIKLHGEPNTLHLRTYLANPSAAYSWADLRLAPQEIQDVAAQTSSARHTSWSQIFDSGGGVLPTEPINAGLSRLLTSIDPPAVINDLDAATGRALADYLQNPARGLFFDPDRNHDAWVRPAPLTARLAATAGELVTLVETRFPMIPDGDAVAETLDVNSGEVEAFQNQIEGRSFEVADATATVKTRGSAQRAFAGAVKPNYGYRCAITGITTREFLVASHIVPWSEDQSIRLDPSNGICLSLLVDRAFEKEFLLIEDDYTIRINWDRVGDDEALRRWLEPYDGQALNVPASERPKPEYLRRRRAFALPPE